MKTSVYPLKIMCVWRRTVHEVKEVNGFVYTEGPGSKEDNNDGPATFAEVESN